MNRSYLQFDASGIPANTYDHVTLKLTVAGLEKNAPNAVDPEDPSYPNDHHIEIRTVPEGLPEIANMTWSENAESVESPYGDPITDPIITIPPLAYGSVFNIDVTGDYILEHLDSPILFQINGVSTSVNDGWISFYSQEAISLFAVPTLIFKNGNDPDALDEVTDEDTVVDKKYYTLQGLEVNTPVKGEIYILKKIYASAKTSVVKVLIRK
jgi:hypothetical protein